MAEKKIPKRKCLGCGEMFPKRELVRVVKTKIKAENEDEDERYEISLDLSGKKPGRGAYICKNMDCFLKAKKAKRFSRALECQIDEEIYERMEQELKDSE